MAAPSFATGQVTIGSSTPTLLVDHNQSRHAVLITNLGTTAVYIGLVNVTTTTGQILPGVVGASLTIPTVHSIYGIASTGSQAVSFIDV